MSNFDIFKNTTKSVPESDEQIVRIPMYEIEIQGRKDHYMTADKVRAGKSSRLPINHVPNAGGTPGGSA